MKLLKNLFIDSNIWLSLYHFSNDDLEQFSKLKELINKDINLLIPEQTHDEVIRNRDAKIKDALTKFEKFSFDFPAFSKNYDEYNNFYRQYSSLKASHRDWVKKIKDDINNRELPADIVIKDFFNSIDLLECNKKIVNLAGLRYKRGNPPGKDNKYGDAINWECLLEYAPNEDIYIISADKDYASVVDDSQFNLFLQVEWEEKKNSHVIFFKSLVSFLKEHFASIKLKTEQEKDELISSLSESFNFATTHAIVDRLNKYSDWTESQQEDLFKAVINNSQISWIIGDDDVFEFYRSLLNSYNGDSPLADKVRELLLDSEQNDDDSDDDDDIFSF